MLASPEVARTIVDPKAYADGRIDFALTQLRREAALARVELALRRLTLGWFMLQNVRL